MNKEGKWSLSPAFDMTYSYNPAGSWTATHQMTLNGKRDGFVMEDFREAGNRATMKQGRARTIVEEVTSVVARWPEFAKEAEVSDDWLKQIQKTHRLSF
jgi:serine/threonine-protein kinase HipA